MRRYIGAVVAGVLVPFTVWATCALKSWGTNDVVRASDLNTNFSCINNQVPANGTIADAQIASNAAINLTKLSLPALIPRAWATTVHGGVCSGSPCTIVGSGVTSITRGAQGVYTVNLTVTRNDLDYGVVVTPTAVSGPVSCNEIPGGLGTSSFGVNCYVSNTAAAVDSGFTVEVFDDENGSGGF